MAFWLLILSVAVVLLFVAWSRWPRERRTLPSRRRILGTAGLVGATIAALGCTALLIYLVRVGGVSNDWSIVGWTARLFWLCLASFGLSWFCRGLSRVTGVAAGLMLAVWLGLGLTSL